jgi:hypothetical protein
MKAFLKKVGFEDVRDYWTSGKWSSSKKNYVWEFGTPVAKAEESQGVSFQREIHRWADGEEDKTEEGKCVAVWPNHLGEKATHTSDLKKMDCKRKLPFICQRNSKLSN